MYRKNTAADQFGFNSSSISVFNSNEEFTRKNRLIRYHYTSAGTLKNILLNGPALRFSDTRFMNDRSEMVYFVNSLIRFLSRNHDTYPFCWEVVNELLLKGHTKQEYLDLSVSSVQFTENSVYPFFPTRSFLFCMSSDADSLPMWNYYVHRGKYEGYNIGFDVYNVLKSFDTNKKNTSDPVIIRFGKVLYNERDHFEEIKNVADFIEKDRKRLGDHAVPHNMVFLQHYIETYGLFFKHDAFSGEKEYRIVLSINENTTSSSKNNYFNENVKNMKLDYFERAGVLVPYIELPINKNAIRQITISPTIENDIAEKSIEEIISLNGYSAKVRASRIPIRF